uniref:Uncharacterized protein n=1 Tax=Solanum lycopersicum TaxID=4081 RepID=A0A3Q7HM86_SOLLC
MDLNRFVFKPTEKLELPCWIDILAVIVVDLVATGWSVVILVAQSHYSPLVGRSRWSWCCFCRFFQVGGVWEKGLAVVEQLSLLGHYLHDYSLVVLVVREQQRERGDEEKEVWHFCFSERRSEKKRELGYVNFNRIDLDFDLNRWI